MSAVQGNDGGVPSLGEIVVSPDASAAGSDVSDTRSYMAVHVQRAKHHPRVPFSLVNQCRNEGILGCFNAASKVVVVEEALKPPDVVVRAGHHAACLSNIRPSAFKRLHVVDADLGHRRLVRINRRCTDV